MPRGRAPHGRACATSTSSSSAAWCCTQGKIAEMPTGEGKTLVATLPAYLNALTGRGVHVVTVNDYLARRDTQWMGPIYHALGLTVGVIQHEMSFLYDPDYVSRTCASTPAARSRREAYGADITYGTNNEFGFDYLRDNMRRARGAGAARARLRHRGRGGHHPDRRGPHAADHLRPAEESTDKYYRSTGSSQAPRPHRRGKLEVKATARTTTSSTRKRTRRPDGAGASSGARSS